MADRDASRTARERQNRVTASSTIAGQQLTIALPRGRRLPRRAGSWSWVDDFRRLPPSPAGSQLFVELRNTINLPGAGLERSAFAATLLATTSGSPWVCRNRRHLAASRRTSHQGNATDNSATVTAAALATQITFTPSHFLVASLRQLEFAPSARLGAGTRSRLGSPQPNHGTRDSLSPLFFGFDRQLSMRNFKLLR